MRKKAEHEEVSKNEKYLIEKVFESYQMEIDRKDRLQSKIIGYYTVQGVSLAAFLVIEPVLFEKGLILKYPLNGILPLLNMFLCIAFFILFCATSILFHKCYEIKERNVFDPVGEWDTMVEMSEQKMFLNIRNFLFNTIIDYKKNNDTIVNKIKTVNAIVIVNSIIVVSSFILFLLQYYL